MIARNSLKYSAIITLTALCQSLAVVSPAQAFWFFHHKKDNSQFPVTKQNYYPANEPFYSQVKSATHSSAQTHRLLPLGTTDSSVTIKRAVPRTNVKQSDQASAGCPIKQLRADAQALPDSTTNVVPVKPISVYTSTEIRIGIGLNMQNVRIAIVDGAQLINNSNGEVLANLPAQSEWKLQAQDDQLVLQPAKEHYLALQQLAKTYSSENTDNSVRAVVYTTSIAPKASKKTPQDWMTKADSLILPIENLTYTIKPASSETGQGVLALNDRMYRGAFLIRRNTISNKFNGEDKTASNFSIINVLDLEDYLLSVVPSEMPSLWPAEALKAQAIAARSYAVANRGKHGSAGYDLKDNTEDQMYLGVRSESQQTNDAVFATKGLVLKYDGKPICAYFHSASGGNTEIAENVWHRPVPYLKAVADFDQEAPLYSWTKNYTILQTESGLPKDIGQVLSIAILAKSPSGHATHILVNGSNNSRIISGEAARKYFSLPSSNFNVTPAETAYIFNGKGFGHGLGLSQWGAKALAKHGYNAAQILCYYYNGVSIDY